MKNLTSPLFSIIVANYNNGRFLDECIESIKSQTYKNWEIVLIDDASTDKISFDLYEKYKTNPKIKLLFNNKNQGVGYTKRRAIENAKGEYCGIVDPDDKIIPETLELVANEFIKHPNAAIVHTNHFICDENLTIIKTSTNSGPIPKGESQLSYEGPKIGPFWAMRMDLYNKTDGINANLKCAEDQDIYYKLEEYGEIFFIDYPTYYYRYHDGGISTTNNFYNAIYWNLIVSEEARKRRKRIKCEVPNISRKKLSIRWLNYYHSVMIEKAKSHEIGKVISLFNRTLKHFPYDKSFTSIKILSYSLIGRYK